MSRSLPFVLLASLMLFASPAFGQRWHTNTEAAQRDAKKRDLPILMFFTGSDWCPYCIEMKRKVFNAPQFRDWARDNVVLQEVDFPRKKRQSEAIAKQNEKLKRKYNAPHFPYVVFVDAEGKVLGTKGYGGQDAEAWVNMVTGIVERAKAKPDEAQVAQTPGEQAADESGLKVHTDLDQAKAAAVEQNKLILAVFLGRDWHLPSQVLDETILQQEGFQTWAQDNVVVVEIDFPRKTELPEDVQKAREAAKAHYKVTKLPTTLLLDASGKELSRFDDLRRDTTLEQWMEPVQKAAIENEPPLKPFEVEVATGDDAAAAAQDASEDLALE